MPQGSPLLQFIRGFTKAELQAIPERCDWCRVRDTDLAASKLSYRIRESIKRNVDAGNITYADAMQDIRLNVLLPGPLSITRKIRDTVRETSLSRSVLAGTSGGDRESWYSAQLYGALTNAIVRPYTVHHQYQLNSRDRVTPDIYIESQQGDGDFIIELRRASKNISGPATRRQLQKYHQAIDRDLRRKRSLTFLVIVGDDLDMDNAGKSRKSTQLSEYMEVPSTIDEIENDLDRVEVISNTFPAN